MRAEDVGEHMNMRARQLQERYGEVAEYCEERKDRARARFGFDRE